MVQNWYGNNEKWNVCKWEVWRMFANIMNEEVEQKKIRTNYHEQGLERLQVRKLKNVDKYKKNIGWEKFVSQRF